MSLAAGITYYFIRSSPVTHKVTMVRFVQREAKRMVYAKAKKPKRLVSPQPLPLVERMWRADFETGLRFGHIQPAERKPMPPWLNDLEGRNLELYDASRRGAAKSHADRVDDKLFAINGLVQRAEEILDEEDPERVINKHARSLQPQQNETRVRLWFFVYLAFGRNRNSLHYPVHRIGNWNRLDTVSVVKRGAPGLEGATHGHNTTREMYNKIIESYTDECGIGVNEGDLYVAAMRKHFGCKSRWVEKNGKKVMEMFHPNGEPFPLQGTYFHHVRNRFRPRVVKETRMGRNRARSEIQPVLGTFTESSWNLMQRVEADGYRVYQLPKGYVEGSDLPPLVVVTKRDSSSGKKTGIGFSQGSETGAAYRMATFCEAIGLVAFGRLFGLKVKGDGHSNGVSPRDITDRGPGATAPGLSRDASLLPVVRETTPAHAGQSKALVETSNPKTPSNDEAPSFERSNLNVIQLARREIFNLLLFNESTNVASRIDPDIADIITRQSPNGIWEALDSLGRNDAVEVSFDDAVRAYLELVPATLRRGGVELVGRNYYSKSSEFATALESAAGGDIPVKVYVLTACVRHVWFEWKERLIELDVRYPIPVANAVLYMSLEEALEYHKHAKKRDRKFEKHQRAVKLAVADDYEDQTGLKWNAGQRVSGRPKRGGAIARREAAEAAKTSAGRKVA